MIALVVVAAIVAAIVMHLPGPPTFAPIPTPTMPVHNARTYLDAAEKLMRDTHSVDWAVSNPMPREPSTSKAMLADPTSGYHVFTLSEKQHLVDENKPAIAAFHSALKYPYASPPIRSFDTLLPYFAKDRSLARLLNLAAEVDEETGNWKGAINRRIDAIQLGSVVPRGANMIGNLVGIACEQIARKHLHSAQCFDQLTESQARTAAMRLAAIDRCRVPFSQSLQEHEWSTQASLLDYAKKHPRWRDELADTTGSFPTGPIKWLDSRYVQIHMDSLQNVYDTYTVYMGRCIAFSRLSWPRQYSAPPPAMPRDFLCGSLIIDFTKASYRAFVNLALNRLIETQLALRAYHLDHGAYPLNLSDLTPADLPSVPLDPFTEGKPFCYRRRGGSYVLYSVGSDCVDNGGAPIVNPLYVSTNPEAKYSVANAEGEKGDIVAGINW